MLAALGRRELDRIFAKYPNDQVMSRLDLWRMDWALWLSGAAQLHPWYVRSLLWYRRLSNG